MVKKASCLTYCTQRLVIGYCRRPRENSLLRGKCSHCRGCNINSCIYCLACILLTYLTLKISQSSKPPLFLVTVLMSLFLNLLLTGRASEPLKYMVLDSMTQSKIYCEAILRCYPTNEYDHGSVKKILCLTSKKPNEYQERRLIGSRECQIERKWDRK